MTTRVKLRLGLRGIALAAGVLAGCSTTSNHAPVLEHGAVSTSKKPNVPVVETVTTTKHSKKSALTEKDWRPQIYVVQKGDTLHGIAFNYGLDYKEIAQLNNIQNPNLIQAGQEIRLFSTNATTAMAAKTKVVDNKPQENIIKDQPKVVKVPYSEQALADMQKTQDDPHKSEVVVAAKPDSGTVAKAEAKPEPQTESEAKAEPKPETAAETAVTDDTLEWGMPTNGKVIGEFSESANRKGVDISGKLGQPIVACAAGKVVYSGSGLRGYGKLVIIKHNNTFLSAYAHNDQVLVKEGQTISKGQKIAEMGSSDTDQVMLHFEIRKFGKPVDPSKYLPLIKS